MGLVDFVLPFLVNISETHGVDYNKTYFTFNVKETSLIFIYLADYKQIYRLTEISTIFK